MEKYYQVLILLGVICYRIDQLDCQDSTTGVITDICGEHLYHCKNGVCINETLICNGKRDCQDGDDEENCVAGRTNSSIFCAKTNGQCTCVDGYLGSNNKYVYLDLNCTDAGLTSFPKLLNTNLIREIFLKGNKIPKLTAGNLNGLDWLDSLILQHNEINTIENDTFRGLSTGPMKEDTHLTRLDLSDNNLTELTAGMFEHLPALFLFSLARNQINTIEKNAFHHIRIGRELDLSGNKLEKLTPGIFNKIDELNTSDERSVYAANHGMPKFGILRIVRLNLRNNKIQIIEPYTFGSIQDLEHLNLAGNKITKLTSGMFKGYLSLVTLHLEENGIDTIENNTFADFYILNMLYLSRNKLTKLTRGMFNSTQLLLQYLYLNENEIDTIESYTFISFPGIELLDLSYNKLTKLEDHTFKNLGALKDLSLAKNQISHIETSTFHELYELQLLNLTGNPLHEVDSRLFLRTHPKMTVEVDDMNICCQTKKIKCYSPNATYDYCEQLEQSMQNAKKVMWYMGIGVLLVAVIIILVAILKFNICGIKKKFSSSPYVAPNDDAQL